MQNNVSYVDVSTKQKTSYFQLDNWDEVASTLGNDNMKKLIESISNINRIHQEKTQLTNIEFKKLIKVIESVGKVR